MKFLSVAGTTAMFFVGGGIIVHGIPMLAHWLEHTAQSKGALAIIISNGIPAIIGFAVGLMLIAVIALFKKFRSVLSL
jgi:predicted DNA repair protein MutK